MANNFGPDSRETPGYFADRWEEAALSAMNEEKAVWDEAQVFVTENDAYLMRKVIDTARRYTNGVYTNQYDEVTGEKKTWVPMTEYSVESVVKSIDLDTKDILIMPGRPSAVGITHVIKASLENLFKKIGFGPLLNQITREMARDGTVVVKTTIDIDPRTGKKYIRSDIRDLLNIWIDPSAESIHDSTIIDRTIKSQAEMDAYKDVWKNLEFVTYTDQVAKIWDVYDSNDTGALPYAEVWERWGKIKKSWVTGKMSDKDEWIEGYVIASGLGQPQVIHFIGKNPRKDGRKPYEEARYKKMGGRWYGRGVPEMLFGLQEYLNMVVNTRKMNNMVLQNGIFLIRKGSGITPDMLSSITAGGGLPVTNVTNDIKQLPVQDFRQSSYTDEDRVYLMADRVTSAFDITRGEVGKASASATATLSRERNIRDAFVLIQEEIGFFIERLIVNQYIPLLKEIMSEKDIIRVSGDSDVLAFIDEQVVNNRLSKFVAEHIRKTGFYPEEQDVTEYVVEQRSFLKSMGKQRFIKYFRTMFDEEVDIEVHVTDEKFNKVVAVQQLRDMLLAYSRLPIASKIDVDAVLREMLNIMGLKGEFFLEKPALPEHAVSAEGAPRPLKAFAEGEPTELGAQQIAGGLPQQGPPGQPQPQPGLPPQAGGGAEPLRSRLDIKTRLSPLA
jgi:hypothetical protein